MRTLFILGIKENSNIIIKKVELLLILIKFELGTRKTVEHWKNWKNKSYQKYCNSQIFPRLFVPYRAQIKTPRLLSNFAKPEKYLNGNTGNTGLQCINPLSVNPTKWSNTLKQFVGKLATNCLSVFDHFVGLGLKGSNLLLNSHICFDFNMRSKNTISKNSYYQTIR